ncbi:MAG: F0F1 ATP synthase subunit A, partial [Candidatus Zixiibacteriota bacterium]
MILLTLHKLMLVAPSWVGALLMVASGGSGEEAHGDEHGEDHSGPPHLPSLIAMVFGTDGAAYHWINIIYAFFIAVVFSAVSMRVYAKRQMIPGPLQNLLEMMVEGMYNFVYSILGEDTKKYIPYLGTLFFYILAMNLMGIIPGGHSPSTSINITASLAILTFLYAQWTGITRLGVV